MSKWMNFVIVSKLKEDKGWEFCFDCCKNNDEVRIWQVNTEKKWDKSPWIVYLKYVSTGGFTVYEISNPEQGKKSLFMNEVIDMALNKLGVVTKGMSKITVTHLSGQNMIIAQKDFKKLTLYSMCEYFAKAIGKQIKSSKGEDNGYSFDCYLE